VVAEARDRLAEYGVARGDRRTAIGLYRSNIEMLSESAGPRDKAMLAADYGALGALLAPSDPAAAKTCYQKGADVWEALWNARQLPAEYAGKSALLRRAAAKL